MTDRTETAQESRLSALLAALLDPTVVIDDHGRIEAASDSVERVFGYAPAELVGRNVRVLMTEPHRSAHDGYLARYRETGVTNILNRTREFEVVRKDGSTIVCELSVARAEMGAREGPRFVGSFRDVTERRRSEQAVRESERRFRALFEGAFQFVGLLSVDGTLLEANPAACESAGVSKEDVVGRPFWETAWWSHSREMQDRVRDAVARAARGEFVRADLTQLARGGEVLDVDFSMTPVVDEHGRVELLIPEGRDVTALKAAQRAETSMLRALATVGESAALLAHEIKNPITAVNVALRAVAKALGEDHRAVLEDLVARMKHLEELMRRTLSFARPLDLRVVDCDAGAILDAAIARASSAIAAAGATVVREESAPVALRADPQLLGEVVSNLLANALEARDRGARVVLGAAARGPGAIEMWVEDDGPGIPEDRRSAVFKPFVTTKSAGTGLGLAICRKIVEEHGGTISVEAGARGGARFVIRLGKGTERAP